MRDLSSEYRFDAKIEETKRRLEAIVRIREISAEFPGLLEELVSPNGDETIAPRLSARIKIKRASNYRRIKRFFRKNRNQWAQAPAIAAELGLTRGTVATILWTTHKSNFEQKPVPGFLKKKYWRLKPELLNKQDSEDSKPQDGKEIE